MGKTYLILIYLFLLAACEKEDLFRWDNRGITDTENDFIYMPSPVFDVIAPSYVKLGDTVLITVRSQGNSGCAEFSDFRQSQSGRSTLNIQAIQKTPVDAICTMALITLNSTFEFIPETRGKHTLNFWRGELHEYDFVTLEINVR
jgi:hypothetical protein